MDISNVNPKNRSDDPVWNLLAEFSIGELISDHDQSDELRAVILFQVAQALGMSPEWVGNIETTLSGFAKEALIHYKREGLDLPEQIRVFCQKKVIEDASFTRANSRPYDPKPVVKSIQTVVDSSMKKNGGWGYFLVERGEDFPPGSALNPHSCIDLYLYQEGE